MTLDLRALRYLATMAMPLGFEAPDSPVPSWALWDFKKAITPQVVAELLDLVEHRRTGPDLAMSMYLSRDDFHADLVRREAEALVAYADKLGMTVSVTIDKKDGAA